MPSSEVIFPDVSEADENGLLCVGGDLEPQTLLTAYRSGVFPWPHEGYPMLWFAPDPRGVLEFSKLHWPRRFLRRWRSLNAAPEPVRVTFDTAFEQVIQACSTSPRGRETGTWILPNMIEAYVRLFQLGYAHSVECWRGANLIGGLYGVLIDGVFSGESMFHKETDASKICLHALTEKLRADGFNWIDIQMVTPVLETLGAQYISRADYMRWLAQAHARARENDHVKLQW
jgi:leucyl/phenylalanyl-tRNA--protein transferase